MFYDCQRLVFAYIRAINSTPSLRPTIRIHQHHITRWHRCCSPAEDLIMCVCARLWCIFIFSTDCRPSPAVDARCDFVFPIFFFFTFFFRSPLSRFIHTHCGVCVSRSAFRVTERSMECRREFFERLVLYRMT